MKDQLTVIVCTYNRSEILNDCLEALVNQTVRHELYKVIVVDNNSTDRTQKIVVKFEHNYPQLFSYVHEPSQGLSYARNRGAKESTTEWLLYLDDDGLAAENMVERAIHIISNYHFDCFGGTYTSWFKYGKPRWMPDEFGTKELLLDEVGQITSSELDGGLLVIKKEALLKSGGFPTDLGMRGARIAYGEETALQEKLLKERYTLGFDPNLKMRHLVGKHKLTIGWHIKAEFARGRDSMNVTNSILKKWSIWLQIKVVVRLLFSGLQSHLKKMNGKTYFIENVILDTFKPIAYRYGQQSNKIG